MNGLIRAAEIYGALPDTEAVLREGWLLLRDGRVASVGTGEAPQAELLADFADAAVAPSFIDMHCHGGAGHAFDELVPAAGAAGADAGAASATSAAPVTTAIAPVTTAAAAAAAAELGAEAAACHRRAGVGRLVLSLVTADMPTLTARTAAAAHLCAADNRYLGIHLEGPFLAAGKCGAHDPALLRAPLPEQVEQLLTAANGQLLQVTIAPELEGACDAIERFVAAGVRVAVGHTSADYQTARRAFAAGASVLTHAFNGMHGLAHRAPGPVAAAFDCDWVTLEVIADGHHVDPRMVQLLHDNAPGRVALISDAMAAACMPDGEYMLGELPVRVVDGLPRLLDQAGELGSIAGSTLQLLQAVNRVRSWGFTTGQALAAASRVPARALGVDGVYGSLQPGCSADFVVLNTVDNPSQSFQLRELWLAGVREILGP